MRIVVCDDEILARRVLASIITEAGHEVVAQVATGCDAVEAVKTYQPDVVLIDIYMPEKDGINCAHEINQLENPPAIIFVTASDQHAIKAFQANVIGYVLKPANKDELLQALNKATRLNAAQLNNLKDTTETTKTLSRRHVAARTHRGVEMIALDNI